MKKSGVAHFVYEDEENTIRGVQKLLSYLPSNNLENPPYIEHCDTDMRVDDRIREIIPDDPNKPYDIKDIINLIIDRNSFFEVSDNFAQNLVVGFGRLRGKAIGILANQPKVLAGVLDINSSVKGSPFYSFLRFF